MLPKSLAIDIINETVRWDQGQIFTIAGFLAKYSLHDSHWLGLHLDTSWDGDATAIIAFDPIWNQIGLGRTPLTSKWPILLIRFPAISAINLSEYKDVGGVQRGIADVESKQAGNEETKTIISDHYGGQVIIVHQDPVRLLCFTATGESVELKA